MKLQFLVISIIIISNIALGCDPKTRNCHEKSSGRPRDRKRGKRAPGSNLLKVSEGHGPYARFCNAMTIAYDLRYKINEAFGPIAGELMNLDEPTSNLLMAYDSNAISALLDSFRDSLTLTEGDLTNIAKEMGEAKKFREDFNKIEVDQDNIKSQYGFIEGVKGLDYKKYGDAATALGTFSDSLTNYAKMTWSDKTKDDIADLGASMANLIATVTSSSNYIHTHLVKLENYPFNPSLFKSISVKGRTYNGFFGTQRWSDAQKTLLNDRKVFRLLEFVEHSAREKSLQVLKAIQDLVEVAEKEELPIPFFNRTWTRAFVPGSSDLETFEKELNGPKFRDLFQSEEDFSSMRIGFKQVIRFGKAVTSARPKIFEKAKVKSLKDHLKELQSHLLKFDSMKTPEGYRSFAHLLKYTYKNAPEQLDQSSFQTFTDLIEKFKAAATAQGKLIKTRQDLMLTEEFKWLLANKAILDEIITMLREPGLDDNFNKLKNHAGFRELKGHLPELINLLSKVRKDSEALKNELPGLEALEQETPTINEIISDGFQKFTMNLEDAPKKTLDVIKHANDHLALNMDGYKKTLADFQSIFVGEMNSIKEKTGSVPLPEGKDAIDLWHQYAYRRLIEEKLIAGFLVFGYFDQVLSREAEILSFLQKNYHTWLITANDSLVPIEFFEKMYLPEHALDRTENMFEQLKALDQKIDSSKFTNTRELENWQLEISLTDCPEVVVADWIEANNMLTRYTDVNQTMVAESLEACKKVQDLNLDWAYHKRHAFAVIRGVDRLRNYMHLVYKVKKIYEKPKVPMPKKKAHLLDPIVIIVLFIAIIPTAYVASRYIRFYNEKKYGQARRDFLAKKMKVITTEIAAELKIKKEDFYSIKELYNYRDEVRKIWHQNKSDPKKVQARLYFRRLLEEARDKGTPIETTIQRIAEQIQESYKEYRGPTRVQHEMGNYFLNTVGNMVSLPWRLYRIMRNNIPARHIWQFMTRRKFSILVDFQTLWYDDYQVELDTYVRGKPNQYVIFWSEEVPNPFKNVEMRLVVRTRTEYEMVYMRYQNFPVGFAPFELTPCQVIFEMIDEMKEKK
ncbi:unnamed protein product [Caenorhabditis brenneri]